MNREEALKEAKRCLNCPKPRCVEGCPVRTPIPQFIKKIADGDIKGAGELLNNNNFLSPITCRVCDQQKQCEGHCIQGIKGKSIAIGELERFVNDNYTKNYKLTNKPNGKKVAIIGSGPSGLVMAKELAVQGYAVTIYEKEKLLGGMLRYGIPDFRMDKSILENIFKALETLGVKFITNKVINGDSEVQKLLKDFDYVYLSTGAGVSKFMDISGDKDSEDIYGATEFMAVFNSGDEAKVELLKKDFDKKKVVVVGGGNVAMDAARTAQKLGATVTIVYRRSQEEMPARRDEFQDALACGAKCSFLTNPHKIFTQGGKVTGLLCDKMELGEKDDSGRATPKIIPDSDFVIDCNKVIFAVGQKPSWVSGKVKVDNQGYTGKAKVYAGGDLVSGPDTVVGAVATAKLAAQGIMGKIKD